MDSKIPASFWGNDALTTPELLLAAAWLRTHAGINLAGFAEISLRRFTFETHLAPEALDRVAEALGKGLVRQGTEYWLRDFIADEFGRGPTLVSNNMSAAVVKDLAAVRSPWVALAVLEEYPELSQRWDCYCAGALAKPLARGAQAQGAGEGVRAGEGGKGKGAGKGSRAVAAVSRPESLQAVLDHVQAEQVSISADECAKFFDHFEANGWKQGGKTPLRSWQAALRNWARRAPQFGAKNFQEGARGGLDHFNPNQPHAHTGGAVEASQ